METSSTEFNDIYTEITEKFVQFRLYARRITDNIEYFNYPTLVEGLLNEFTHPINYHFENFKKIKEIKSQWGELFISTLTNKLYIKRSETDEYEEENKKIRQTPNYETFVRVYGEMLQTWQCDNVKKLIDHCYLDFPQAQKEKEIDEIQQEINGICKKRRYQEINIKEQMYSPITLRKDINKIKWLGSPSIFGFLMTELVKRGYIEPPLRNGESNYAGFAKLCYQYFDIDTTQENLIKEMNPGKCTLSDTKREKFTIPELSDLR